MTQHQVRILLLSIACSAFGSGWFIGHDVGKHGADRWYAKHPVTVNQTRAYFTIPELGLCPEGTFCEVPVIACETNPPPTKVDVPLHVPGIGTIEGIAGPGYKEPGTHLCLTCPEGASCPASGYYAAVCPEDK